MSPTAVTTSKRDASPYDRAVPVIPLAGTALKRALHYEYMRLRGLRSTWVVLAALITLSLLNGVLLPMEAMGAGPGGAGQSSLDTGRLVDSLQFNPIGMQLPLSAWMLVFVFGTGPITTEFSHRTARTAWLTVGSRSLSYAAKLITGTVGALTASVVGLVLSAASGSTAVTVVGLPQPDWWAACGPLLRYLTVMACLPVLAGGLAACIRSRLMTVLILALWPLMLERGFGLAVEQIPGTGNVSEWFPFAAARAAMSGTENPEEFTRLLIGSDLAPLTGLAVFSVSAALIAYCGWQVYRRREAP
ncbi:ABC transporter permease [Streptomyces resistomycificus]|uniref:Uncharacterized protein n=1 Tax=Streptomyces resistomycificus TaxID=67356 RepID=A0A0L8KQQ8_9ACTN|nr:ABC transporter permease [Streptomyces resistomycificus]KOG28247.1 hypothetical protein ADK37_39990 [Streptomyces resistomycificus]KUN98133.1 hypothetical protein AQJ84_15670 [Streptomyces resistomycificus]